jgi:hypothetical protein
MGCLNLRLASSLLFFAESDEKAQKKQKKNLSQATKSSLLVF